MGYFRKGNEPEGKHFKPEGDYASAVDRRCRPIPTQAVDVSYEPKHGYEPPTDGPVIPVESED